MAHEQAEQLDEKFFERADAHIALATGHINQQIHPGRVSNSFMFAASRLMLGFRRPAPKTPTR